MVGREPEKLPAAGGRRPDRQIRLLPLRRRLYRKHRHGGGAHPQTILATRYANETIADPFGYPLRLRTATKLGYKNAKWIKAIEVTNSFTETFWSKQGFNWFAGI
ncbi:MAG: molybdopterin-dependent oxidoreductase [Xanthobacteraceae bacterium]